MKEIYQELMRLAEEANNSPAFQRKAGNWDKTIQFEVIDDEKQSCTLVVKGGKVSVQRKGAHKPDIQVITDIVTFAAIVEGDLKPSSAFIKGQLKVEGTIFDLIKINSLFKFILKTD